MRWCDTASELTSALRAERGARTVGFVPTMGALHEGHLSLVRRARAECDLVVASVFVNPLQFGPSEDFERYPRDPAGDRALLAPAGCDLAFTTTPDEMYPAGYQTYVVQEGVADVLEGAARPGHFRGVLTIVLKLLLIVRPDRVYLGRKDYQQTVVIGRMVRDLGVGTEVRVCPTKRDPDGLAKSSRNRYLSAPERAAALAIPRALEAARARFAAGERSPGAIRAALRAALETSPSLDVEYAVAVDPDDLLEKDPLPEGAVALIAARSGATRLIDNADLAAS